jgi:predicted ATPase
MISTLHLKNFKCFEDIELPLKSFSLLAGLNGSGKSSIIQILLLLNQSFRSGDLQNGRLALSGDMADLGTGEDILFEGADDDLISLGLSIEGGPFHQALQKVLWTFAYDREADRLINAADAETQRSLGQTLQALLRDKHPPFGGHFQYIHAERYGPRKILPLSESHARELDVGVRGEYVLHVLMEHGQRLTLEDHDPRKISSAPPTLLGQVDAWLQEISPGVHLTIDAVRRADSALSGFKFDRQGDVATRPFRATNVGFGLSYALPVIVALLSAPPKALILLENPEAHAHPKGQTRLGQLAARTAAAGVQVVVETHSDHVMNGARIDIRQHRLPHENAFFHYFRRAGSVSEVISCGIGADGLLDHWPEGFFDQHDENLVTLLAPDA